MSATGKQTITKASHLSRARERLEKAVTRLDHALSGMAEPTPTADVGPAAEEMIALKAENAKLQEASRAVSGRLEQTIGKLKAILES